MLPAICMNIPSRGKVKRFISDKSALKLPGWRNSSVHGRNGSVSEGWAFVTRLRIEAASTCAGGGWQLLQRTVQRHAVTGVTAVGEILVGTGPTTGGVLDAHVVITLVLLLSRNNGRPER